MSDIVFLRVNGEHLHSFRGQPVCVLGRLTDVSIQILIRILLNNFQSSNQL